jgi:lipoprotein-releasing system permease protein
MNLAFTIARRYFFARKSHHIINIISWISVAGIMVGTMAMVVVLSVFNGFDQLVQSLYSVFDPDIKIVVVEGKTFVMEEATKSRIATIPGVLGVYPVTEETALLRYTDKQFVATVKGVDSNWVDGSRLDTVIARGTYAVGTYGRQFGVMGAGVAWALGVSPDDVQTPVFVYLPNRTGSKSMLSSQPFITEAIFVSGVFSVQQDFDTKYCLIPRDVLNRMLGYIDEVSAIEVRTQPGVSVEQVVKQIETLLGNNYRVLTRYEQQETLFKIMKSEKWAVFMILTLIIFISAFNLLGSLSMLIIDKRQDIAVLSGMGAGRRLIKRIFFIEGLMISFTGLLGGLILGFLLCLVQKEFGLVPLGGGEATFVVSYYPVKMIASDFLFTMVVVSVIGLLAAYVPAWIIGKRPVSYRGSID